MSLDRNTATKSRIKRLTLEERVRVIRLFSMYESSGAVQKAWEKEFKTDAPSRKTITAINRKFEETGNVADLGRCGRPKSSRTAENRLLVENALRQDPTKSIRMISMELAINKASVQRIKQDSEKSGYLKMENRKLREKISELYKRIDVAEGKMKPSLPAASKKALRTPIPSKNKNKVIIISTKPLYNIPDLEPEEAEAHTITITEDMDDVVTVLTNEDDMFTGAIDLGGDISNSSNVRHLTINNEGHLMEIGRAQVGNIGKIEVIPIEIVEHADVEEDGEEFEEETVEIVNIGDHVDDTTDIILPDLDDLENESDAQDMTENQFPGPTSLRKLKTELVEMESVNIIMAGNNRNE